MATIDQIVIDCEHPAALARFWELAVDDYSIRAYDDREIARLATLGFTPETDPTVMLDGPHLSLCFQHVATPAVTKRSLHLDLRTTDRVAEVDRLVRAGASVVQGHVGHTWMRDPEGNDFCVFDT